MQNPIIFKLIAIDLPYRQRNANDFIKVAHFSWFNGLVYVWFSDITNDY